MKRVFSLLIVLIIIFIIGCGKEDLETITGGYEIKEIEVTKEDIEVREKEEIYTVRLCHDTDNGIIRWVNGSVFGFYDDATRFEFNDYCQNFNYLVEFYCEDEEPEQQIFLCRNGCVDAHCQ